MTNSGTIYDQLTLEELNQRIIDGDIQVLDLPNDLLSAWAAWEPEPVDLTKFRLCNEEHRREFLYQYCAQGEPALFVAVGHIWDSLAEPREARCALIGAASGVGGKGKMALVSVLNKLLEQSLEEIRPLPSQAEFGSLEARHEAVMASFQESEQRVREVCAAYSAILNGAAQSPGTKAKDNLIVGPWSHGGELR